MRLACAVLVVTYVKKLTLTIVLSVARRIYLIGEVQTQGDLQSSVRGRLTEVVLYWYLSRPRGAVAMRQQELPRQSAASQHVHRHFGSSAISVTFRCAPDSDSVANKRERGKDSTSIYCSWLVAERGLIEPRFSCTCWFRLFAVSGSSHQGSSYRIYVCGVRL